MFSLSYYQVVNAFDLVGLHRCVALEKLYRMVKAREMGHFNFLNQKPAENGRKLKTGYMSIFLTMVDWVASVFDLAGLHRFVALEKLCRMVKTRKMGHCNIGEKNVSEREVTLYQN